MKMKAQKILIIDDEAQIRRLLRVTLLANNYEVEEAENARTGVEKAALYKPDLILLDLGLPDEDGSKVLSEIRQWSQIPIIILSVRDSDDDLVNALENGADDYIVKPFSTPALIARIRAALRHNYISKGEIPVLTFGNLTVDLIRRQVLVNNQYVKLTKKEYELLRILAINSGKVITQQNLLTDVWGPMFRNQVHYLRIYIRQLRTKIEKDPKHPRLILTESGVGYRLREEVPATA